LSEHRNSEALDILVISVVFYAWRQAWRRMGMAHENLSKLRGGLGGDTAYGIKINILKEA